jgi:hypothetical protein
MPQVANVFKLIELKTVLWIRICIDLAPRTGSRARKINRIDK